MTDFWLNSGYHLLDKTPDGYLKVTNDFFRAYLQRAELAPIEESCEHECKLHDTLMEDPQRQVGEEELTSIQDKDTIGNYRLFLSYRDKLVAAKNIESFYLSLFQGEGISFPPMFIDNLVHVIMRNVLDGCNDPYEIRVAELFFREQTFMRNEGALLLADSETVENIKPKDPGMGDIGRMLAESGTIPVNAELDVLNDDRLAEFWQRSDKYDLVLDLTFPRDGVNALCKVISKWVAHFYQVNVDVSPTQQITDERWVWHIGLDKYSTQLLNDLYEGQEVGADRMEHLLSLFRLDFSNAEEMRPDIKGRPVYMGLCASPDNKLNFKPQNILLNLPIAQHSAQNAS